MKDLIFFKISIFLSLIYFIGCGNQSNQENLFLDETLQHMQLANKIFRNFIYRLEAKKIFGLNASIKLDELSVIQNYEETKKIFSNPSKKKNLNNLISNQLIQLDSLVLNKIRKTDDRWKNLKKHIQSVKKSVDKRIQNNRDLKSLQLNLEILYNMIFQVIVRHKFSDEWNYGNFVPQVTNSKKLKNGSYELEIHAIPNESDTYDISIFCDKKRLDKENSSAKYIYNPEENNGDSTKIMVMTTHRYNGAQYYYSIPYKPE